MSDIFETIECHLPPYLSPKQKEDLYKELKAFPESFSYYYNRSRFNDELLQGDGWSDFAVIDSETMEKKQTRAIVLSNTCDVDPNNKRALPPKIIFAPLVKINRYKNLLENFGLPQKEINNKLGAIRRQEITSIFYLPAGGKLEEEYMINLDDLHSQPLTNFHKREKLFTLSLQGFYIFILKLSIHFCRFNDGVIRL